MCGVRRARAHAELQVSGLQADWNLSSQVTLWAAQCRAPPSCWAFEEKELIQPTGRPWDASWAEALMPTVQTGKLAQNECSVDLVPASPTQPESTTKANC